MKTNLLCSLLLMINVFAHGEGIHVHESKIRSVNLYQNNARIEREFDVKVTSGINNVFLHNISVNVIPSSILVSGSGDAIILSVRSEQTYLIEPALDPQIKLLQDSIEMLTVNLLNVRNKKSSINEHLVFLNSHKNTKADNASLKTSDLEEVGNYLQNKIYKLNSQLTDENRKEKEINELIAKLNNEVNIRKKSKGKTSSIVISLQARSNATVKLAVEYVVSNCGWVPSYDLTASKVNEPIQLIFKAGVFQNTGEDWNDVALTISTGDPSLNQTKPILQPWYLQFVEYGAYMSNYRSRYSSKKSAVSGDVMAPVQTMEVQEMGNISQSISQAQMQLFNEFMIPSKFSLKNNTNDLKIDLSVYSMNASYKYFSIPKLDKDAFLIVSVTGWENLSLLPGMANIRFENRYIGESFIDPLNTNDTLVISLGRDKSIQIERKIVRNKNSSQWIGSSKTKLFEYEIKVKNLKTTSLAIEIGDQVPISNDSDIEVKINDISGGSVNSSNGEVLWNESIKPQGSITKKISFTIKYPKNKTIPGI